MGKIMKNAQPAQKTGFILLSIFVILWMIGIGLGEPLQVLKQAITICLECIGIG